MKASIYTSFQLFIGRVILVTSLIGPILSSANTDSLSNHLQLGMDLQKERKHMEAIAVFENALDLNALMVGQDSMGALLYHRMGISHYRLRERKAAIKAWESAISFRERFLPSNHIDIVKTNINIANAFLTLSEYRNATNYLNKALELLNTQSEPDQHNLSRIYNSLGSISRIQGDYEASKNYLSQSYDLKKELYLNEPWELINITTELFDVYKDIGSDEKMLKYAELSLQYAEATPNDGDQYYFDLANSHNNLGIAYSSSLKTDEAIHHFERSATINNRFSDRSIYLGINFNNLILQYNRLEQYSPALDYAEQAKNIFSSDPTYIDLLAETYVEEGDVNFNQENYGKAISSYKLAIEKLIITDTPDSGNSNSGKVLYIAGSQYTLMDAKFKMADCLLRLGKLNEAKAESDQLIALVHQYRRRISDRESKKYLLEYAKQFFELSIEIQYELFEQSGDIDHLANALNLFDQSKSSILYDALSENALSNSSDGFQDLMDRERGLLNEIINLEFDLIEADAEQKDDAQNTLLQRRLDISLLRDSMFRFINMDTDEALEPSEFIIEDIQSSLDVDEMLIQYFVGERFAYAIAVASGKAQFVRLQSAQLLGKQVAQFLPVLRNYNSTPDEYVSQSLPLYQTLVEGVVGDDHFPKLLLIPDGFLSFIPFEALAVKEQDGGSFTDISFLIKDSHVRYVSSYSVYQLQQDYEISDHKKLFTGMSSDYKDVPGFAQMNHADTELDAADEVLSGDMYKNEEVRKDKFLEVYQDYQMLHLSLHGVVDRESPSLSYLQFPAKQNLEDQRLYAAEIYNLNVDCELVVLSACETGSGTLAKGDGIQSLAHAFAYAGAKSTIMSLWQIPSVSTASIVGDFYTYLSGAQNKNEALRSAKLEYIKTVKAHELVHPFYWSSLILYGDKEQIDFENGLHPLLYIVGLGAILWIIYWIFSRRLLASKK